MVKKLGKPYPETKKEMCRIKGYGFGKWPCIPYETSLYMRCFVDHQ